MTTTLAPEASGRSFNNVMVVAQAADSVVRREVESDFVASGSATRTHFIASQTLFPARGAMRPADAAPTLRRNNVDGVLVVRLEAFGSDTTNGPPAPIVESCAIVTVEMGCQAATVGTSPPLPVASPWMRFSLRLYDPVTQRSMWSATSMTRGTSYAHSRTLLRAMEKRTVEQLVREGLIR